MNNWVSYSKMTEAEREEYARKSMAEREEREKKSRRPSSMEGMHSAMRFGSGIRGYINTTGIRTN